MTEEVTELIIIVTDEEKKKLSKPFLTYETIKFSRYDPYVAQCIKEVLDEFKGVVDDMKIKATMVLK